MSDITITLSFPQAIQVQAALDHYLAHHWDAQRRITELGGKDDPIAGVAVRNLESARTVLTDALYSGGFEGWTEPEMREAVGK